MSANSPISVTSTPQLEPTAANLDTGNLETVLQSGSRIIKHVTNARLRVDAASEELHLLHEIESQVTAFHSESLSALRFRRNQLTCVNRLSDEILLMIFWYAPNRVGWEMLQYLPLTWICRRWRALAVNSPVLWKLIDLSYMKNDVLEEVLRRSKGSKLSVGQLGSRSRYTTEHSLGIMGWSDNYYSPNPKRQWENFETNILANLNRVEILAMKLRGNHWIDAFLQRDLCPSIRRCRLQVEEIEPKDAERFFSRLLNAPHWQLEVLIIHSTHLSLCGISESLQVPNLQTLVLKNYHYIRSQENLPDLRDVLRVLQSCCSALESMELSLYPGGKPPPASLCRRISMTRLSNVILDTPASVQVMEYLSTPVLNFLRINGRDMSRIRPLTCFENLPHMIFDGSCVEGRRASINGQHSLGLKMELNDPRYEQMGTGLEPHFAQWASHLTVLEFKVRSEPWPEFMLRHAHGLRTLRVGFNCEAIFPLLEDVNVCPQLETFTYKFRDAKPGKQLLSIVKLRQRAGIPLEQLVLFTKEPVAKTHVQKLRQLVEFKLISEF